MLGQAVPVLMYLLFSLKFKNLPNAYSITIPYYCALIIYKYTCNIRMLYFCFFIFTSITRFRHQIQSTQFFELVLMLVAWTHNKDGWSESRNGAFPSLIWWVQFGFSVFLIGLLDKEQVYTLCGEV